MGSVCHETGVRGPGRRLYLGHARAKLREVPPKDLRFRLDRIPDVRDGLTRVERLILRALAEAQRESGRTSVATSELYGRVAEHIQLSESEFQETLGRLVRRR